MAAFMESDALVLCAIAMCSVDRVASLRDLIGTTDHLNAGYATLDEINGAVERLASANLIDRQARALAAGSDARDLLKKNQHLPSRLFVPLFKTFLETKSFVQQGDAPAFFSNVEYQTVCAEYHRDMKAVLRGIWKNR
jgi:hypothetical protein